MAGNPSFGRLELVIGGEAASALERSRVIVVGLGGVGSWCAEALVRSGVGKITLVDSDAVAVSNINRQVEALSGTVGRLKTEALEERLKAINPACEIQGYPIVFSKESAERVGLAEADYIIDAIDSLNNKLDLIECALALGFGGRADDGEHRLSEARFPSGKQFFSCMGMAWKLDPTQIRIADIWETSVCPLAALVRQGMRKRNITGHFPAVYSAEQREKLPDGWGGGKKAAYGSSVTVTAAAGMALASLVIRDACNAPRGRNG